VRNEGKTSKVNGKGVATTTMLTWVGYRRILIVETRYKEEPREKL